MLKNNIIWLTVASVLVVSLRPAHAQNGPTSGLYQIISGEFRACCGIAGQDLRTTLPNEKQMFVRLSAPGGPATMTFLGHDMETVFGVQPCPVNGPFLFSFDNGLPLGDSLLFRLNPFSSGYIVSNAAGDLRINGRTGNTRPFCADAFSDFSHSNVVAVLMPEASIRISEVEVCWPSTPNRNYQVQYRSMLTTNAWTNLGSPVAATSAHTCVTDKVALGQPQRFYRVLPVPSATPVRLLNRH